MFSILFGNIPHETYIMLLLFQDCLTMHNSKQMVIVSQLKGLCPGRNLCGQPVKVSRRLTNIFKLNNVMHFTLTHL